MKFTTQICNYRGLSSLSVLLALFEALALNSPDKSPSYSTVPFQNAAVYVDISEKSLLTIYLLYQQILTYHKINKGHAVRLLVESLRYKPEGRGFDSRWCLRNFSLT